VQIPCYVSLFVISAFASYWLAAKLDYASKKYVDEVATAVSDKLKPFFTKEPRISEPPGGNLAQPSPKPPAFAVAQEFPILSFGGNKYGTRFWLRTPTPRGCTLYQAQAVIYLRIENLRPYPVTVVSYTLKAFKPMVRLSALNHSIFGLSAPGESFYGATRIGEVVPAQQGSGSFAWSQISSDNLDFSHAKLLEMDTLDEQIVKPLTPNVPVRGWAFFEYPLDKEDYMTAIATRLSISIKTAERDEPFSYPLRVENGDPNGDVLPRDWKVKDIADISSCERQRLQIPH
jgi:hypothetical protein